MFKITVEQQKFVKALKSISGSVGKGKQENPTDSTVYMEAFNDNGVGKLKLTTTNFNEWTTDTIDMVMPVIEGVAPLITYERLMSLVSTVAPTVEIVFEEVDSQKMTMNYVGRKSPIEMAGFMNTSFIPEPQRVSNITTSVPLSLLKSGIDKAGRVITDTESKPLFNCVNITINEKNILFECIDSITNRVMIYVVKNVNPTTGTFFVECNKMKTMLAGFDEKLPVEIEVGTNNIAIKQDGLVAILRLLNGSFPSTVQWFPTQYKNAVAFNRDEMINALKRIQAMYDVKSNIKTCGCEFNNMFSTITMNSGYGNILETVVTNLKGDSFEKCFDVDTFIKSLYSMDTPDVQMVEYDSGIVSIAPVNPNGYVHKLILMQIAKPVA